LLDLRISANLIPLTEYEKLGLGKLKPTKMGIELAHRSTKLHRGVVEDVMIRVGKLIYPMDIIMI